MIIVKKILVIVLMTITLVSCKKEPEVILTPLEEKLASMTLDEKLGQMVQAERYSVDATKVKNTNMGSVLSGGGSHPSPNTVEGWLALTGGLNDGSLSGSAELPLLYGVDAVHGHNNLKGAVLFPHNIALGATHDEDLLERIGKATAIQLKATGVSWDFAPCLAVVQDVRWGRTYESYSEDPQLVSSLGAAFIKGLQSEKIMATAKHYLADGGTDFDETKNNYMLDQGNVTLSEAEIRELHLPPYIAAIEANVLSVMVSFSSIDDDKMHASTYWITDVLKTELGFKGVVVSDWEAIHQLPGSLLNQVSASVNAGVDILMEPNAWRDVLSTLKRAVENDMIPMSRIDDAVMRILYVKDELGLENMGSAQLDYEGDKALAREAVAKSQVLLLNKGVLPLQKEVDILLIGPGADNAGLQNGGWSFSWQGETTGVNFPNATTLLDAFREVADANGGHIYTDLKDASKADIVVLVLAEVPYAEGIGDTSDLSLTGALAHEGNADAIRQAEMTKKPILTLLMTGRPVLIEEYVDKWDAIVASWLFGTEAQGVTDVLYGDVPFTGTLSFTWPKTVEANLTSSNNPNRDFMKVHYDIGYGLITSN
jgi:beta-glucosidase